MKFLNVKIFFPLLFIALQYLFLPSSVVAENKLNGDDSQANINLSPLVDASINVTSTYSVNDDLGILYAPKGKEVLFKKAGSDKAVSVFNGKAPGSGLKLFSNKKRVYAFWWNKTKSGKTLRVKSSIDGGKSFEKSISYVARNGVLPVLTVASDDQDKIAVAYISEREPGYQVYFNRSLDGGKSWFKDDRRINTIYDDKGPIKANKPLKKLAGGSHVTAPYLTYIDKRLVLVWQEIAVLEGKHYLRLLNRISADDGKTWSAENEIFKIENVQPQEMQINKLGNKLLIALFLPKKGVYLFSSDEKINNWEKSKVRATTENIKTISYFHTAQNDRGDIFLTFVEAYKLGKDKVKIFRKDKNKQLWENITEKVIAKKTSKKEKPFDAETKETAVMVESFVDNTIIVTWQDYSNILPTVLINISRDGGISWLKIPLGLASLGKIMLKDPRFIKGAKKLWLVLTYLDVQKVKNKLQLYYLPVLEDKGGEKVVLNAYSLNSLTKKISKEEKLKLLKKRTDEFWKYRVNEEYGKAYEYFDPLYRLQFRKLPFMQTQGKIRYLEAKTGNIVLYDNIAFVDTKISFSLTVFEKAGLQTEPTPPQKREMKGRWGWFYDNWYLMPATLFDNRFEY